MAARLVARPLVEQATLRLTPVSSTLFRKDLAMKIVLPFRPLFLIQQEQLLVNGERLYTKYW